ncbi:MAG: AAA family ATPase [Clostridiales bacterium]|jgi:uncharacterized protein YhaN|nr:AAA family ATPase [Clostridiales bacterium]
MNIKRIEIDAFGKFNKFVLDFSEGFQIIHGGNEDGKTTLMDFIKLMLYSKADTVRSLQSPRRKYIPFSGRPPAGSLIVERGGQRYVIQKSIGESPGKDRARIINMSTGREESFRNQEAGQRFIGLDAEGFEQICFIENIGKISAPAGYDTEERTIANLTGAGDKRVSRHVIIKRLTDAKESLVSKSGKNGDLVDARAKLQRLKNEKAQTDFMFDKQAGLLAEYESLLALYNEQRKLRTIVESLGVREDAAKVESLLNMIKDRSKDQAALSRPNIPSDRMGEYLERLRQASDEYFSAKKVIEEWSVDEAGYDGLSIISDEDVRQYESYEQRILVMESEINALPQKSSLVIGLPPAFHMIILILIAAASVASALYFDSWRYLLLMILMIPVSVIVKIRDPKVEARREAYIKQIALIQTQAEQILKKNRCATAAELNERYIAWKTHAKNIETQSRLEIKLNGAASRFIAMAELYEPVKTPGGAQALLERLTSVMAGMEKHNAAIHDLAAALGFSSENPSEISARLAGMKIKIATTLSGQRPEEVIHRWNSIKDEDFSQQLLELQKKLKTPKYTPDQLEGEIAAASASAADMALYYKALESALSVMEESADELRAGFGAELNRRAGDILNGLTNGEYSEILVAKDYALSIKADSQYREYEYFSSGAIDQAYLALRLALSEITSVNAEPFPLLLDDALMQYDDARLRSALKLLSKREGQTVLFTCHKYVVDAARPLGAQIARIRTTPQLRPSASTD